MNGERRCEGGIEVGVGVGGLVGEAHSSSHYRRWLLWYFSLSISGGGGEWGEIPKGRLGLGHLSSISHPFLPLACPCPASPLTVHLLTTITPPSSSPPLPCLPLYLPPLLHLPSLSNSLSLSHTHTHQPPSPFSVLPSLSSFLHFSREAALDSQKSLACQKLLLTFQFSVFFSHCSLLMPYSRKTFTCQWARQKRGTVCPLPCP